MSFITSGSILLEVISEHKNGDIYITTEYFNNSPPIMEEVTTETFANQPPPMEAVVTEFFDNNPPAMESVVLEQFDGFTLNHNLINLTNPDYLASFSSGTPLLVEQDVGGGTWVSMGNFAWGAIGSIYFYPARNHRVTAPSQIIDGLGIRWLVQPPNPFEFMPQYTSDVVVIFAYQIG